MLPAFLSVVVSLWICVLPVSGAGWHGVACEGSGVGWAVVVVEHAHHLSGDISLNVVPDRLPVAATGNDAVPTEQRQMLRNRGIADAQELRELSNGFLPVDQAAKDQKAVRVRQRLHQLARLIYGGAHFVRVDGDLNIHEFVYTLMRI